MWVSKEPKERTSMVGLRSLSIPQTKEVNNGIL